LPPWPISGKYKDKKYRRKREIGRKDYKRRRGKICKQFAKT
jgi:hypothetical protein